MNIDEAIRFYNAVIFYFKSEPSFFYYRDKFDWTHIAMKLPKEENKAKDVANKLRAIFLKKPFPY